MECLASFVGTIYECFCIREFLSAAFIDVKVSYDAVHIPILRNSLLTWKVPQKMCLFLQSLFSCRDIHFFSLSGAKEIRTVHRGLPQGSCLSPILFNVYISSISKALTENGFPSLFMLTTLWFTQSINLWIYLL